MNNLKPLSLWTLGYSPNPWKVAIILEELGIPYEKNVVSMAGVKEEPYLSLNPNGRVPTIEDPNTGITLWEVSPSPSHAAKLHETNVFSLALSSSISSILTTRSTSSRPPLDQPSLTTSARGHTSNAAAKDPTSVN